MFDRHSRYRDARPFVPPEPGRKPFGGVRPRPIGHVPGVIEHQVQAGDRLDLLARHYYNNDRLWWRIVDANPEFLYAGDIVLDAMHGKSILIPRIKD
jgi:nucleoid-associated protein YgaU